ncbi:HAD family hydrolase [Rhodobacter sp. NTK016B]|uniref:HAD family hydrolase n=1 Tax=Rhodobacter sp. NTK016B TaxID=2759676 RepID=UPI001A8FD34B|nr:HAD family hydrolase [Rhodobacter sp. NTK016B]MBN8290367.1 HAD family hydrolase [Rhodobacter sp. NTK016B]
MTMQGLRGILFDKDGTLFDFQATWGNWARDLLNRLAGEDPARAQAMAEVLRFDLASRRFDPASPVIAGTGDEVVDLLAPYARMSRTALSALVSGAAAEAPLVPAVPLRPLLARLRASGLRLGVATNDYEAVARRHLAAEADLFDLIAGFDSGHGGKPAPGMLLAFAEHCGLRPDEILMVGDSRHDLLAGRAAGMRTLAVLTGVATEADLEDLADAVRPDIGHLPELLALA